MDAQASLPVETCQAGRPLGGELLGCVAIGLPFLWAVNPPEENAHWDSIVNDLDCVSIDNSDDLTREVGTLGGRRGTMQENEEPSEGDKQKKRHAARHRASRCEQQGVV